MADEPGHHNLGQEAEAGSGEDAKVEEEDGEFGGILDNNVKDLGDVVELG
jgi:hypothetical protein